MVPSKVQLQTWLTRAGGCHSAHKADTLQVSREDLLNTKANFLSPGLLVFSLH